MDYSRREFFRLALASLAIAGIDSLPWPYEQRGVTFTSCEIDKAKLTRAVTITGGTKATIECRLDLMMAWEAVTLYDSGGREWHTLDGKWWMPIDGTREVAA